MQDTQILVATNDAIVQIRVIGRATFLCSQSFRDFCSKSVSSDIKKIIIDLSECLSMDSTFMGVLAMLGMRTKKISIPIEIVNSNDSLKKLLKGLGLEKLFAYTHTKSNDVNWTSLCETEKDNNHTNHQLNQAKTMLDAHETLIEVEPLNSPKFKDVVEFLKNDINKLSVASKA